MANKVLTGDSTVVKKDGTAFVELMDATFTYTIDMKEVPKYGSKKKHYITGLSGGTMTFGGYNVRDTDNGTAWALLQQMLNTPDSSVDIILRNTDASVEISFEAYFGELGISPNAPGEPQTFSGNIQPTGDVSINF